MSRCLSRYMMAREATYPAKCGSKLETTPAHRAHKSSYAGFEATSSLINQHRAHLFPSALYALISRNFSPRSPFAIFTCETLKMVGRSFSNGNNSAYDSGSVTNSTHASSGLG